MSAPTQMPAPTPTEGPLPGFKVLLAGPPGSGKTTALKTLHKAGLEVFGIFTDPGLIAAIDEPAVRYTYIKPVTPSWEDLIDTGKKINSLSNEMLQKMQNIAGPQYTQWLDILRACNDFVDTRTGKHFGDVATWSTDRVLCIDGLTGLSIASRNLAVGSKPALTQPDWGVMMNNLARFLDTVTALCNCHLVLIGHVEQESDLITGATRIMCSTLGRKLAPVIPYNFTDFIYATKEIDKFYWSTAHPNMDLKAMHLPFKDKMEPTFAAVLEGWKRRGGVISSTAGGAA